MATRLLRTLLFTAAAGAFLASCQGGNGGGSSATGCKASGNPIDEILCDDFAAAHYEPVQAAPKELCTRASVDLLGVRPGRLEMEDSCFGRDFANVVKSYQGTKEYRQTQRRRWADRFHYNDYMTDVGSIRELDELVNDLYKDQIGYKDFAVRALSHPGFVGANIGYGQPELVAEAAFQAFLGRSATAPERIDVGTLWKPWMGGGFFGGVEDANAIAPGEDGEPIFGAGYVPMIDPFACEAGVRACESTLLGPASLEFERDGRENYILSPDLTDADILALQEPGRLFVQQPMFWEAQVDEVLGRYLGYDLGKQRPDVRQRLVNYFKNSGGDLKKLEYIVVTSWLYRQSAEALPARPESLKTTAWAYGPTKTMLAETFLASVGKLAGEPAGNCDWRYPNLPEWYYPDPALDEALNDVYPRDEAGYIDPWFRNLAVQMGGCPGTMDFNTFIPRVRSNHVGLMTAVAQEEAVIELCFVRDAHGLLPGDVRSSDTTIKGIRSTVKNVLERAVGPVDESEVDAVMSAKAAECPTCDAETVARDLCAGIASGAEFLFY